MSKPEKNYSFLNKYGCFVCGLEYHVYRAYSISLAKMQQIPFNLTFLSHLIRINFICFDLYFVYILYQILTTLVSSPCVLISHFRKKLSFNYRLVCQIGFFLFSLIDDYRPSLPLFVIMCECFTFLVASTSQKTQHFYLAWFCYCAWSSSGPRKGLKTVQCFSNEFSLVDQSCVPNSKTAFRRLTRNTIEKTQSCNAEPLLGMI